MTLPVQRQSSSWVYASVATYIVSVVATIVGLSYMHFSGLDPFDGWADTGETAMWGFLAFSLFASGTMIVMRQPENPIGRLLLFSGLTFALAVPLSFLSTILGTSGRVDAAGLVEAFAGGLATMWVPLVIGALILFPTGALPSSRWKWLGWLTVVLIAVGVAASMVNGGWAGDIEEVVYTNPLREPLAPMGDTLASVWQPISLAVAVGAAAEVIVRFRRSKGDERQQMKWLTFAIAGIVFALLITAATSSGAQTDAVWQSLLVAATLAAVPIGIAIAVLKYKLYDIDLVIRRTLTFAIVLVVLGIGFAIAVSLPLYLLGASNNEPPPNWLIAGATLGAFLLFNPVRKRVRIAVERRFNRLAYDPQAVSHHLQKGVRDTVDPNAVTTAWTEAVVDSLEPRSAGVWLRKQP